ncbi:GDSL esterase/lipase At5g14450-like isoform X2 [Benincasa hispida]|uniref:GDSL esterase/lipase At5g14450-like isoform X2 n=1 Tax=Benincasa hispida TaxID=102211 RepID=UPI0019000EAB|nr:GDSL esterase/lipase At5g14450-like isoform X2 [Benincasa hispida]
MKMKMKIQMALTVASILISMADSRACDFPAIYNFGDSNSDTGGISAAFYPTILPCGETFFHKTAGRGCDGRLIIDFIAKHLELPYLSAYLNSIGTNFRHGANFATGGSTIRRQNESVFENGVSPFSLDIQIVQFRQFKNRTIDRYLEVDDSIKNTLPIPEEFSKAIFTIDIGQNDLSAGFRKMTNAQFLTTIPNIIDEFSRAIEDLYKEGARAFWVHNTGPIGCIPVAIRSIPNPIPGDFDQNGCVRYQNDAALEFNKQLKERIIKLRTILSDASLVYVDVFAAKLKLIANAKEEGFMEKGEICCGYHEGNNHVWCGNRKIINGSEVYGGSCDDPSKFISWDGVHYTEAANRWIANQIVKGSFSDPQIPITHACR